MNRKEFLQKLPLLGAIPALIKAVEPKKVVETEEIANGDYYVRKETDK